MNVSNWTALPITTHDKVSPYKCDDCGNQSWDLRVKKKKKKKKWSFGWKQYIVITTLILLLLLLLFSSVEHSFSWKILDDKFWILNLSRLFAHLTLLALLIKAHVTTCKCVCMSGEQWRPDHTQRSVASDLVYPFCLNLSVQLGAVSTVVWSNRLPLEMYQKNPGSATAILSGLFSLITQTISRKLNSLYLFLNGKVHSTTWWYLKRVIWQLGPNIIRSEMTDMQITTE